MGRVVRAWCAGLVGADRYIGTHANGNLARRAVDVRRSAGACTTSRPAFARFRRVGDLHRAVADGMWAAARAGSGAPDAGCGFGEGRRLLERHLHDRRVRRGASRRCGNARLFCLGFLLLALRLLLAQALLVCQQLQFTSPGAARTPILKAITQGIEECEAGSRPEPDGAQGKRSRPCRTRRQWR